jgi:hypothetical protein
MEVSYTPSARTNKTDTMQLATSTDNRDANTYVVLPVIFMSGVGDSASKCCINERDGGRGRIEGFVDLILSRGTRWRLVAGFTP